jgi:hypothetical protein
LVSRVWPFFQVLGLLPIGWGILQILQQRRGKTTNTEKTNLSEIQEASRFTFINAQLYYTCDLWE